MGVRIPEGPFSNVRFFYPKKGREYLVFISGIYHVIRDGFGFVDIEDLEITEIKIYRKHSIGKIEVEDPELANEIIELLKRDFNYNTFKLWEEKQQRLQS
nr:MAG TPA: hypothetical protein [Bacteriophage sp.]